MILAVASGKGGTGKTTIAANLAYISENPLQLIDCDVEEPNDHLFIQGESILKREVTRPVPYIEESLCNASGECSQFCAYNAIATVKNKSIIFPDLCHSCGGCALVCPQKAIREIDQAIGLIEIKKTNSLTLVQGQLKVGIAMPVPLIREVKKYTKKDMLNILDAPPGTSCPVVATLNGADFVILVTEPTAFGLHDLTLAVKMVQSMKIPFGVVVNRMGIGDNRISIFCQENNIPILMEIPDDRKVAELYSKGILASQALPQYQTYFKNLLKICLSQ